MESARVGIAKRNARMSVCAFTRHRRRRRSGIPPSDEIIAADSPTLAARAGISARARIAKRALRPCRFRASENLPRPILSARRKSGDSARCFFSRFLTNQRTAKFMQITYSNVRQMDFLYVSID